MNSPTKFHFHQATTMSNSFHSFFRRQSASAALGLDDSECSATFHTRRNTQDFTNNHKFQTIHIIKKAGRRDLHQRYVDGEEHNRHPLNPKLHHIFKRQKRSRVPMIANDVKGQKSETDKEYHFDMSTITLPTESMKEDKTSCQRTAVNNPEGCDPSSASINGIRSVVQISDLRQRVAEKKTKSMNNTIHLRVSGDLNRRICKQQHRRSSVC